MTFISSHYEQFEQLVLINNFFNSTIDTTNKHSLFPVLILLVFVFIISLFSAYKHQKNINNK